MPALALSGARAAARSGLPGSVASNVALSCFASSCERLQRLALLGEIRQTGHDAQGRLLQRAKGHAVSTRRQAGRDEGDAAQLRRKEFAKARPLQSSGLFLLTPDFRFGNERQQERDRNRGDDTGEHEITPGGGIGGAGGDRHTKMAEILGVADDPQIDPRHGYTTKRSKSLGDAEPAFLLLLVGKNFRHPGDSRDELDAHTDERDAAPEDERMQSLREGARDGRQRVDEDADRHHRLAPEPIDKPAAQQSEDATAKRTEPKQPAHPIGDRRIAQRNFEQFGNRLRPRQRRHQELVGIEEKPNAGDDDDQPALDGEFG